MDMADGGTVAIHAVAPWLDGTGFHLSGLVTGNSMIRFHHDGLRVAVLAVIAALCPGIVLAADAATAPQQQDFLQAHLDPAVDPGVDFFEYANGGWLASHPIPASESSWGIGNVVDEQLYVSLRNINEQAARSEQAPGSDQQKIGDFWTTAMDTAKADRLGVHPLDAELARIDAVHDAGRRAGHGLRMAAPGCRRAVRRRHRPGREEQRA